MRLRFRCLYQNVKEGEIADAIICFHSQPWEIVKYGLAGSFVKSYRKVLRIDFFIVILTFEWIAGGKKDKSGNYKELY